MPLYIFQTAPFDRHCRGVVCLTLHLVDVPVRLQVTQVTYTYIGTETFRFLVVPQGESIVVTIGKDNRVTFFLYGAQVVLSEVACHITVAAVVVVPRLAHHLDGYEQTNYSCNDGSRFLTQFALQPLGNTRHTHAYPDGKCIERTCVCIVTFAGLHRGLVQIKYDGQTGHEEQEEYDPELLDTYRFFYLFPIRSRDTFCLVSLPEQTDKSQNQRQAIEYIVSFVVFQVGGEQALVAHQELVHKRYSGNPVAMFYFTLSLYVILASGKIPHEISPVHVVQLVDKEELDVIPLGRDFHHHHLSALVVRNLHAFDAAQPVFVGLCVCIAVHAREEHILCILVIGLMTHYFVAVLFIGSRFLLPLIHGSAFCHVIYTSSVHFFQCRFGGVCLSVEQRTGSILLAAQVFS